jgi:TPP-dependent pyruvate/acetoin dehydrogenase alpha subunit
MFRSKGRNVLNYERDFLLETLRRMVRIRLFDDALVKRDDLPSVAHTSVGMEASIVGSCMALNLDDYMVGTHRSHGHPIGKGADVQACAAELLGKVTGVNSGKGGSMHLSDFKVGSLGETSIVGSGLPVATGAALGIKMQGLSKVALCFFGDGAAGEGTFHESLNLASLWGLPVVFVCENNGYGEYTAMRDACAVDKISMRAAGYDMPGQTVDGQDVLVVYEAVKTAVDRARSGGGPSLVETLTYRYYAHAGGPEADPSSYRSREEIAEWWKRDPIVLFRRQLVAEGICSDAELDEVYESQVHFINAAWDYALKSPYPDPSDAYTHMYSDPFPLVSS